MNSITAFLGMSFLSMTWQIVMFRRLVTATGVSSRAYRGLVRTSICRVAVTTLYVLVGLNALVTHYATLEVTFVLFTSVQVLWCVNALLDVRLRKHLNGPR